MSSATEAATSYALSLLQLGRAADVLGVSPIAALRRAMSDHLVDVVGELESSMYGWDNPFRVVLKRY